MKQLIALLFLTIVTNTAWSQNPNLEYKNALKVYNLSSWEERSISSRLTANSPLFQQTKATVQFFQPTIAFQWKSKKSNFHEIELTSFRLTSIDEKIDSVAISGTTVTEGTKVSNVDISLRYEFILNFNKSKDTRFVPSVGFGVNPYYTYNLESPQASNLFDSSETNLGMRAFVTPRLSYFINSKIFLDLNIPICFFDAFYNSVIEEDPAIPLLDRTRSDSNLSFSPNFFSGRIGIGVKL